MILLAYGTDCASQDDFQYMRCSSDLYIAQEKQFCLQFSRKATLAEKSNQFSVNPQQNVLRDPNSLNSNIMHNCDRVSLIENDLNRLQYLHYNTSSFLGVTVEIAI